MQRILLWIISVAFKRNSSTSDHIFCIRHIPGKKWEYREAVNHLMIQLAGKSCMIFSFSLVFP
jgi:hypothetical protein